MKIYKGVEIRTTAELRDPRGPSAVGKTRVMRMSDEVWERVGIEARRAGTSIGELIRAVMAAWLDRDDDSDGGAGFMDTKTYELELARAKYFQKCDYEGRADFWMGYFLGLHRAHDGACFQCAHDVLMADAGQKGAGYRAGIDAYRLGVPYKN